MNYTLLKGFTNSFGQLRIITQLGKYWHIKGGKFYKELTEIKSSHDWKDMVTFYLGCSFGMEDALDKANVKLPLTNKNVSMYISNIPCNPSGPFSTNMVVSMRSVPKELLQALFEATYVLDSSHGAPVHIGSPTDIGINDLQKIDLGDLTAIAENEVPVFFACGFTGSKAIESAGLPECFCHAPGHMFICDETTASFQESHPSPYKEHAPCVVEISENREKFSVLSQIAKNKITELEQLLLYDIGKRGIEDINVKGDLLKSLLSLYQSSSVGITFGFPVFGDEAVAEETDGLPGAIDIAKALSALGKKVSFIIDKRNEALLCKIIQKCLQLKILKKDVPFVVYERENDRKTAALQFLYPNGRAKEPRFDHIVSIERTGPSNDGTYRSMKAKVLKEDLIAPVEDLFLLAGEDDCISTSSIGDGGNELGMGKVQKQVEDHVPHGKQIACVVPSDFLITAGVSNWGGYAIAVGLYVLSTCPIHVRYVRRGLANVGEDDKGKDDFLNTVEQEAEILKMLAAEGVRDGITEKAEQSVDGFQFYPHHAEQIEKFLKSL
ncbi:D-glutamate cyclase, mitochondrial-like isoform X2 [Dendronephthya gigantea]|uniref:D-glutamate cyclase, mitochondrial-like isoform X2 n=1 Tax=Dendronephthya gigantea TaxID=151771 RepID=UPI00106B9F21|nr:D-glutamate cyclase, mitochondrial-like isoform X2 [Dendronephthya gigantea]